MRPLVAVLVFLGVSSSAWAWERSHVPNSDPLNPTPLYWCTRKIPFVTNDKGSKDGGAATFDAVHVSYFAWAGPTCTDLIFEDLGKTSRFDVGFDQSADDNINLVVWRETTCAKAAPASDPCFKSGGCNNKYNCWEQSSQTIAITTTTFNVKTGQIYDADIESNGAGFIFTTLDTPPCVAAPVRPVTCVATDVQNTVTHEVGHVIGLDHPDGVETTMYAEASLGETTKRTLHQDDVDGLCFIYPKGKPTTECTQQPDPLVGGCGCAAAGPAGLGLGALLAFGALRSRRRRP